MTVNDLSVTLKNVQVIHNIDLEFKQGSLTCLLGHSGAGKTTFIETILGVWQPSNGSICYKGNKINEKAGVLGGLLGYCSSHDSLYNDFTVYEYLCYIALLKGIKDPLKEIKMIISNCKIEEIINQKIILLSKVEKKKVSLTSCLIGSPTMVFLDEPCKGIELENR